MNLLLLEPGEVGADGAVLLTGRRAKHAHEVLRAQEGDRLRVGVRSGRLGVGVVTRQGPEELGLAVTLDSAPPPRPRIDVLLAIPRPKALKKVLPALASLGVDRIVLVNAARVEKSYFDSKVLAKELIEDLLSQGLEQAKDTVPPVVELKTRFRPFVEDELRGWLAPGTNALVPHPGAEKRLGPVPAERHVTLAIGPDGGWVPFEVELLEKSGFRPVSMGERVLRVEVAVSVAVGTVRAGLEG